MMARYLLGVGLMAAAAAAFAEPGPAGLELHLPPAAKVEFAGLQNFDAMDGPRTMMYPIPAGGGIIASLIGGITGHALVETAIDKNKREGARAAADKVLIPYQSVIDSFTPADLEKSVLERMANSPLASSAVSVANVPVFSMTQDQRALIVDAAFEISAKDHKAYRQTVRVVTTPIAAEAAPGHWLDDTGRGLRGTATSLLSKAVEIALQDMQAPAGKGQMRTIRFMEGASERVERAEVLDEACDRLLLRTLRGHLMSVPRKDASCSITL